ncbi:MAG: ATP-binding cassette domain-containing protein, partial [Mariprofundaceae bacterium]|nr:ATP-binding cassette domain-containing protein [Mariprofundaceae bacterium]
LMEAIEVSHAFGETCIVSDFNHKIMAGDRVGLIGPNGIGKTTLLKIMLGEMQPDSGRMRHGVRLAPAFLTQMGELNPMHKIKDILLPRGGQDVHVGGHEPRHVVSYMQDFLFDKERLNSPVSALSGGERGRLMLAKLLLEPANLLVLDEPTNDLDIGTLAMLELALAKYEGTVILVSHDRAFMDRVANRVLAFEGEGRIVPVEGGYSDYAAWRQTQSEKAALEAAEQKASSPVQIAAKPVKKANKLGYKEQRELDSLPALIEKTEEEKAGIETRFCDVDYFSNDPKAFQQDQQRLAAIEAELVTGYARWEELVTMQEALST